MPWTPKTFQPSSFVEDEPAPASDSPPSGPAEAHPTLRRLLVGPVKDIADAFTDPAKRAAMARAAPQGATAGYGDELSGLLQATQDSGAPWYLRSPVAALAEAASDVPTSQREAAAAVDAEKAASMTPGERLQRLLQNYRLNVGAERTANKRAKEAAPGTYLASEIVSGLPLSFALPGGQAKTAGGMAGAGALAGGLGGLGGSEADLTKGDVLGALADTGIGAGLGAALGAGAAYLPKAVKAAAGKGSELLERLGISQGRKVLTGGTKSISQAAAVSDDAVKRALEEGAIRPFGTTSGAAERLDVLREAAGAEYARIVQALEAAGVVGPERDALAAQLFAKARQEAASNVGPVPEYIKGTAERIAGLPAEARIAGEVRPVAGDVGETIGAEVERLGLTQAEDVKRSLQDLALAEYRKVGGNTLLGDAKMANAADVRRAVEQAIESQSGRAPEAAAAFIPVKQRAGQLIEASSAAEMALNSAKNKNAISLRDLLVVLAGAGKDTTATQKAALLPLSMVARATGPSTVASGAYSAGEALRRLTGLTLPKSVRDALTAAQRAALITYLQEHPNGP